MEKSCENCKYMNPNCSDEDWCTHADVPFQEFTCGGKETFYCKYWEEKEARTSFGAYSSKEIRKALNRISTELGFIFKQFEDDC